MLDSPQLEMGPRYTCSKRPRERGSHPSRRLSGVFVHRRWAALGTNNLVNLTPILSAQAIAKSDFSRSVRIHKCTTRPCGFLVTQSMQIGPYDVELFTIFLCESCVLE